MSKELVLDCISRSKSLLIVATEDNWEQFSELEEKRQQQLNKINLENLQLSDSEHEEISTLMNELITLNQQLSSACEQQRKTAMQEFKNLNQGIKANNAYS